MYVQAGCSSVLWCCSCVQSVWSCGVLYTHACTVPNLRFHGLTPGNTPRSKAYRPVCMAFAGYWLCIVCAACIYVYQCTIQGLTPFLLNSSALHISELKSQQFKGFSINSELGICIDPGMFNLGRVCVCETHSRCNMDHRGYPYPVLHRVSKTRVYGDSESIVGKGLVTHGHRISKCPVHPYMRERSDRSL